MAGCALGRPMLQPAARVPLRASLPAGLQPLRSRVLAPLRSAAGGRLASASQFNLHWSVKRRQAAAAANGPAGGASEGAAASTASLPPSSATTPDQVDREIFKIALPTLATLAADPIAGLISTAWVGQLGPPELAAVGVALSVFNTVTKLFNMPLLSVTTSTVATALGEEAGAVGDRVSTAVSAAISLALLTGLLQAALLGIFGVAGLGAWGAGPGTQLHTDAVGYLTVRALSAPATVLFLTLQGVFRGLGDTRAPFYATLLCNLANIALEPLLIFTLGWRVRGAAGAIAVAQGLSCLVLLALLGRRCRLRVAGRQALRSTLEYLKPTGLLTLRTLCISTTFALATGLAARTSPTHTAAHQVCFQVWLASSLLADSLAVASQALLARTLAAGDKRTGQLVVRRTVQLVLGLGVALLLGLGLSAGTWPTLFTRDAAVLSTIGMLLPAVAATQPVNGLAFLCDGILYGVGGFKYAAQSMVVAVAPAIAILLLGTRVAAARGNDARLLVVWAGLATLMAMRVLMIGVPYALRLGPFSKLAAEERSPPPPLFAAQPAKAAS